MPELGDTLRCASYMFGYILYYALHVASADGKDEVAPIGGLSSPGSAGCFDSTGLEVIEGSVYV